MHRLIYCTIPISTSLRRVSGDSSDLMLLGLQVGFDDGIPPLLIQLLLSVLSLHVALLLGEAEGVELGLVV